MERKIRLTRKQVQREGISLEEWQQREAQKSAETQAQPSAQDPVTEGSAANTSESAVQTLKEKAVSSNLFQDQSQVLIEVQNNSSSSGELLESFEVNVQASNMDLEEEIDQVYGGFEFYYNAILATNVKPTRSAAKAALDYVVSSREAVDDEYKELLGKLNAEKKPTLMAKNKEFMANYFELTSFLNEELMEAHAGTSAAGRNDGPQVNVKCPAVPLPSFDGTPEKWTRFRDMFEALVHNNSKISDVIKFSYLQDAMKIPSNKSNVLDNHNLSADSYQVAWKAVKERYDDKRKITKAILNTMFGVKKMVSASASELQRVTDAFSSQLNALQQMSYELTEEDDLANLIIVHQVVSKLDDETLKDWRLHLKEETASWAKLRKFLHVQWQALDGIEKSQSHIKFTELKKGPKCYVANQSQSTSGICYLCDGKHMAWDCNLSQDEKRKIVKARKLCMNCFKENHMSDKCPSQHRCKKCNGAHHTTLHFEKSYKPSSTSSNNLSTDSKPFKPFLKNKTTLVSLEEDAEEHSNHANLNSLSAKISSRQTLLSTVLVHIQDVNGKMHMCRGLLDSGSDSNFMEPQLAKKLGLPLIVGGAVLKGINEKTTFIKHRTEATVSSCYGPFVNKLQFSLLENISGNIPSSNINVDEIQLPADYDLADPTFFKASKIEVLLNATVFYQSLLNETKELQSGAILVHSKFGWIVGGTITLSNKMKSNALLSCMSFHSRSAIDELDEKLDNFFRNDDINQIEQMLSPEEQYAEDHFVKHTTRNEDGRFVVRLPFKEGIERIGRNFSNAVRQSYAQESRRAKDEKFNKLYVDAVEDFIESQHLMKIEPIFGETCHYLPHHGVVKLSSTTTKLRPVFNASSKSESQLSLNDCLCVGPTIQPESYDIMMRYREKQFVLMGDVTKMYRMIEVHRDDRKYIRILWRSDINEPIGHYEHQRVPFGTACGSFLSTRCVKQAAMDHREDFPQAAAVMENSFYVDDLLGGSDSIHDGSKTIMEIRYILSKAGMHLSKIGSNNLEILKNVPSKDLLPPEALTKTLGICYSTTTDEFSYDLQPMKPGVSTKASVLSEIASIYDLMGWIGPVAFKFKLFMKLLWSLKIDWKQKLPTEVQNQWNELREDLLVINEIRIPRMCYVKNAKRIELHGFGDASIQGYGAVIYVVSWAQDGETQISIMTAKSKVAPNAQVSLARLELCGALLLSKLASRCIGILSSSIDAVTLWSDSTIVLHWISMDPVKLSTYVGNRVSAIQQMTSSFSWRHIAGKDNPADIISRGMSPTELREAELWWKGPSFLYENSSQWPQSVITINDDHPEMTKEVKKKFQMAMTIQESEKTIFYAIENHFSKYDEVVGAIGQMFRFLDVKGRSNHRDETLSVEERDRAKNVISRIIQKNFFPDEYKILTLRQQSSVGDYQISKKSQLTALKPFMDDNGVIRVEGRLGNCKEIGYGQRHPVVLPPCNFSMLVAKHFHRHNLHPGPAALKAFIRQEFWILNSRNVIRKASYECMTCFKARPPKTNQIMAHLPEARVTMSPPFWKTAVDYAGFYIIKSGTTRNAPKTKAYVAMFKCMSTGAIHLELAPDLSTQAFLSVFDRFVARRGLCDEIFSDNGTCFEGADNELRKIVEEMNADVKSYGAMKSVKWTFTAPRAPHAGGYYESGIKSMKQHLKRVIENPLTFEQFTTILCRVEAIVNSRPLTPTSEDPRDLNVITPGHFLVHRPLNARPERDYTQVNPNRLDRFEYMKKIQQDLWNIYRREYFHTLQSRPKNFRTEVKFEEGALVLIQEANAPSQQWLKGRILKLHPGKDNVTRVVTLKTKNGILKRHVKYLCLLPLQPAAQCVRAANAKKVQN